MLKNENMELRINVDYNQILNLINQLPAKEIEKLSLAMQMELSSKKKNGKRNLKKLLLSAPTWTDTEYEEYLEVRKQINNTRLK